MIEVRDQLFSEWNLIYPSFVSFSCDHGKFLVENSDLLMFRVLISSM